MWRRIIEGDGSALCPRGSLFLVHHQIDICALSFFLMSLAFCVPPKHKDDHCHMQSLTAVQFRHFSKGCFPVSSASASVTTTMGLQCSTSEWDNAWWSKKSEVWEAGDNLCILHLKLLSPAVFVFFPSYPSQVWLVFGTSKKKLCKYKGCLKKQKSNVFIKQAAVSSAHFFWLKAEAAVISFLLLPHWPICCRLQLSSHTPLSASTWPMGCF